MPILNYTTTVAATKTLAEIHAILAGHGARSILTEYDGNRQPCGLAFTLPTPAGETSFRLPANVAGVARALERGYHAGTIPRRFVTAEQAARVGWRILKEWVAAQSAIIEAGMVEPSEVFFPYALVPETGRTVYQTAVEQGMRLLTEST